MRDFDALVAAALDDPLSAARRHAQTGGRVVGQVGPVPVELIHAAGAFPVVLTADPREPTPDADRYLEPSFSPLARGIVQQWLGGTFDWMEAVIFTRASDNAQRLYYYLSELQRRGICGGPTPLLYDIAMAPRDASRRHSIDATRRLADQLGVIALGKGVEKVDRRRALLARLDRARIDGNVDSCWAERAVRASAYADADLFDALLGEALAQLPARAPGPRILIAGSTPPDGWLHEAVAEAGGRVVANYGEGGPGPDGAPVGDTPDTITAIADRYRTLAGGNRSFIDHAAAARDLALSAQADGVIFWLIEEEEALVWALPAQMKAMEQAGISALALTRQPWAANQAGKETIVDFVRSLRQCERSGASR